MVQQALIAIGLKSEGLISPLKLKLIPYKELEKYQIIMPTRGSILGITLGGFR
jgi:hypothetical protein